MSTPSPIQLIDANFINREIIGEGSFGKVYRAECRENGYIYALKQIPSTQAEHKEYQILSSLKHPNIIRMYGYYETETHLVLVTECATESLNSLIRRRGDSRFRVDEVQNIACNLVSALHYLHSHRICHRDIKPQNILIGQDKMAKLCDFGFARKIDRSEYLLTSVKGTPLYMAPEVMEGKAYDQSADFWSLGCNLYELLVGSPPFSTHSLSCLTNMIKNIDIKWPDFIQGDCLSFVKGLLEKNPKHRISWNQVVLHAFVGKCVLYEDGGLPLPLTKALSPSLELVKEKQKKILDNQLYLNRFHDRLHRKRNSGREIFPHLPSPDARFMAALLQNQNGYGYVPSNGVEFYPELPFQMYGRRIEEMRSRYGADSTLPIGGNPPNQNHLMFHPHLRQNYRPHPSQNPKEDVSSGSSCETLTSSDDSDDVSDSDDGRTVVFENGTRRKSKAHVNGEELPELSKLNLEDLHPSNESGEKGGSGNELRKSEALFTLHSFGSEDKPIESDEWVEFLLSTTKEAVDSPKILCEKHFLTMIVAPLRNHLASTIVVERIAALLAVPFLNPEPTLPDLIKNLETLYIETKVLPNLMYACKLIVRHRRIQSASNSVDLRDIAAALTEEDLDGMEKCLRLVCFLVHTEEEFVVQFCEFVNLLHADIILQIFFNLDKRKSRITVQALAIVSQVLRTIPSNVLIMEEPLFDGKAEPVELLRLLPHSNPLIFSKTLRVLAYLLAYSCRVKECLVGSRYAKLVILLRDAADNPNAQVGMAAELAIKNLRIWETTNSGEQIS